MAKPTGKMYVVAVLTAIGVLLGIALAPKIPLLSTLYGLSIMSKDLAGITLGQALFGGAAAFGTSLLTANIK